MSYVKSLPMGDFSLWVQREFEEVERAQWDEDRGLRWDDLRFPASGINPVGPTNAATPSTTNGSLEFAGNADNMVAGIAQMPHAWKQESAIRPHLHLKFPTSATANTRWKLEWDIAKVNGDFGGFTAGKSDTITVANPTNVNKHVIAAFAEIAMTGYTWSTIILWRITRLANSDAADNHTAVVELLEFDIHYQNEGRGSVPEYPA